MLQLTVVELLPRTDRENPVNLFRKAVENSVQSFARARATHQKPATYTICLDCVATDKSVKNQHLSHPDGAPGTASAQPLIVVLPPELLHIKL